jgi:hypothetical protein
MTCHRIHFLESPNALRSQWPRFVGFEAQFYDAGSGPRIFTGTDIYDGSGTLLHSIDVSKLGITDPPLVNGVWISGNTFAAVDGQTSTVIVYTVP